MSALWSTFLSHGIALSLLPMLFSPFLQCANSLCIRVSYNLDLNVALIALYDISQLKGQS